ncbi:MAG: glycine zipper domain-containing protein [Steroidobacteraceae bacterium]
MKHMKHRVLPLLIAGLGTLAVAAPVLADPPPHAPAHGWRAKHDPYYRGYTGTEWRDDYGVRSGRCDTDQILGAVGAVTGAVIGNRTASPENRTVATIIGALIGGIVGARIGDRIDDRDRACVGQALELVPVGSQVTWRNPDSRIDYTLRPIRDVDARCRDYELRASDGSRRSAETLRACRRDESSAWVATRR